MSDKPSPATGEVATPRPARTPDPQRAPRSLRRFAKAKPPGPPPGYPRLRRDW